MEIGYIKLYRKITNSFVWTNPNMLKLWMLCLMKASHSGNKFLFNGKEVVVSSGEFVTGRDAIAKEFNEGVPRDQQIVGRTLWRWIKKFEEEQMLSIKSTTKYSVITVKNWNEYQASDQQVSNNRPSTVHQVSTIKNAENAKNAKNKDNSRQSAKRTYDEDSIHYQLASSLFKEIQNNNPEARSPNLQTWSDDIRKMIEIDNRKPEQVENMIRWSQSNDFWSSIILSAKKLREKYDQMRVQALKGTNTSKKQPYSNPSTRKETLPDWAKEENQQVEEKPMDEKTKAEFMERLKKIQSFGKE
ncbi:replication protein [Carnobacterium sp.]|uniref:replication protein n=1 Tax=Carnobacterium sp. TaxID=48221 RepID=UPI00388D2824